MAEHVRVLLVEDEESYIDALVVGLQREGFLVQVVRDGKEALEFYDAIAPDVVLLDVMLPKVSGIDVCRRLRSKSQVPIIMVTAKGEELDTVVGLEVGADDYVSKPYRLRELVSRIRAVLRRSNWNAEYAQYSGQVITLGDVRLDTASHEVFLREARLDVTPKEFDLLDVLMSNAGRVVSRDMLMGRVWGLDHVGETRTLDVHIVRLRSKLEDDPSQPNRILTIRGLGYKYVIPGAGDTDDAEHVA